MKTLERLKNNPQPAVALPSAGRDFVRPLLALLALMIAGCIPANNPRVAPLQDSGTGSGSDSASDSGATGASDGAAGQCLNLTEGTDERRACVSCYSSVLTTYCPGKTAPADCGPTIASSFTSMVNQCIVREITTGTTCHATCAPPLILNYSTCTCVTPSTGGGGTVPDSGQTNYGPPVADVLWPEFSTVTDASLNKCESTVTPLDFLIQNRGDTVPQLNQYRILDWSCSMGSYISSASVPAYDRGGVSSNIKLTTLGQGEQLSTAPVYANSFEAGRGAAWGGAAADEVALPKLTKFMGQLGAGQTATLTLNNTPRGKYLLTFDLYLGDTWGPSTADTDTFSVGQNSDGVAVVTPPFSATFSTAGFTQSYKGPALKTGANLGMGTGSNSIYRIQVVVDHTCGAATCALVLSFAGEKNWGLDNLSLHQLQYNDFEAGVAGTVWQDRAGAPMTVEAGTVAALTRFLGPLKSSDQANFTMDALAPGKYLISFDFFAIDSWTGNGSSYVSLLPMTVATVTDNAQAIVAGDNHTCAIAGPLGDLRVYCWGRNTALQTDATGADQFKPIEPVPGLHPHTATAASLALGAKHTCVKTAARTVRCWGDNTHGQLGKARTTAPTPPAAATNLAFAQDVTQLAGGDYHTCALLANGAYTCWGDNRHGQLGRADTAAYAEAPDGGRTFLDGRTATVLSAGAEHTCAIDSVNGVRCWGRGDAGQLGDTHYVDANTPVTVSGVTVPAGERRNLSAGAYHTCAVTGVTRTLVCWGENTYGQLGNNGTTATATAAAVTGLSAVSTISAGLQHSCASHVVGGRNQISCWGLNTSGQLGNNTTTNSLVPVQVSGFGAEAAYVMAGSESDLTTGGRHSCIRATGSGDTFFNCWGDNHYGQLGNNLGPNRFTISFPGGGVSSDCATTQDCTIFDRTFSNSASYAQTFTGTATLAPNQNVGFGLSNDAIYRMSVAITHRCPGSTLAAAVPATCPLKLRFEGKGIDDTRAWGIDNFGVVPAPQCSVKYSMTDTNALTAVYCLNFDVFTSCGQTAAATASSCSCWGLPHSEPARPFFRGVQASDSCL